MTSSAMKIGTLARTARAMASDGRQSISRASRSPSMLMNSRAWKTLSFSSLISTCDTVPPSSLMTFLSKSWVSGRATFTSCNSMVMASASQGPIQMGSWRSLSTSRSSTMRCWETRLMRMLSITTSIMGGPSSVDYTPPSGA